MPFASSTEANQQVTLDPVAVMRTRLATYAYDDSENTHVKSEKSEEGVKTKTALPRSKRVLADRAAEQKTAKKRSAPAEDVAITTTPVKKAKTTTKQRSAGDPYNPENNLVDSLRPDLVLVFIGLNPGLTTALTGR